MNQEALRYPCDAGAPSRWVRLRWWLPRTLYLSLWHFYKCWKRFGILYCQSVLTHPPFQRVTLASWTTRQVSILLFVNLWKERSACSQYERTWWPMGFVSGPWFAVTHHIWGNLLRNTVRHTELWGLLPWHIIARDYNPQWVCMVTHHSLCVAEGRDCYHDLGSKE